MMRLRHPNMTDTVIELGDDVDPGPWITAGWLPEPPKRKTRRGGQRASRTANTP